MDYLCTIRCACRPVKQRLTAAGVVCRMQCNTRHLQAGTSIQRMLQLLQPRSKWQLLSKLELLGTTRGGLIRTEHAHGPITSCLQ